MVHHHVKVEPQASVAAKPTVVVLHHAKKEKPKVKSTKLSAIFMADPNKSLVPTSVFVRSPYVINKPHLFVSSFSFC